MHTNADTLTQAKIHKLKEEIKSITPPDVIAIVEIKPKKYNIEGYRFEPANLEDKGSSRDVSSVICTHIINLLKI